MATMAQSANYTLNLVPISVSAEALMPVGRQPYDADLLRQLREEHRATHFFKRDGKTDQILSIATATGAEPIGDTVTEEVCTHVPWLVAPLVLESLLRYFYSHDRVVLGYKPLRVVTKQPADDTLRANAPKGVSLPSWLARRIGYSFDTRLTYQAKITGVALACDFRLLNIISASCAGLLQAGVPILGRVVKVLGDEGDPRLNRKRELAGRIAEIKGTSLHLTEGREGDEVVDAASAFLEQTTTNLHLCIGALFPSQAADIIARADAKAAEFRRGPERLNRISSMLDHLRNQELEIAPGLPFSLGSLVTSKSSGWTPDAEVIDKPLLVFDPSGSRTGFWNQGGLDKHGPYDQRWFEPKEPKVAVVCQESARGDVEQFVSKFLEGMPDVDVGYGGQSKIPYEKGFIRRYHLKRARVDFFPTSGKGASDYADACRRAITASTDRKADWNLAIVQIDDTFHLLDGDDNPYLVTKSMFMKRQVPVQEITLEKMKSPARDLVYIMNDISIATYAKLGGIPWLLKTKPVVAHELIIGLGSHEVQSSRFGKNERVVGITTVFSSDGNYLLDNKSRAEPFESYAEVMLATVREAVETIKKEQNWRNTEAIRLIFHAFKPFRDEEVEKVTEVVTSLGHSNATFAFLHLADNHCYRMFDEKNPGVKVGKGVKGAYAPKRGLSLELNKYDRLIAFAGANEIKKPEDGLPDPILLKLHPSSSFRAMDYLSRQAFDFSCHSWRTFHPAPLPITILYSELIARLLRGLEDVSDWDRDAMLGQIGRTRWFL